MKYKLVELEIPPRVIIEGDTMGAIGNTCNRQVHAHKPQSKFIGNYSRVTIVGSKDGENMKT
jgi:hypothetical protein